MNSEELIRCFLEKRDTIMAFILALTRNHDAAEEIFQNVAVAVLREANRDVSVANFSGWVAEVARHRVADYYRQSSRRLAREQPCGTMTDLIAQAFRETEEAPVTDQLRMQFLQECLQKLTGRSREVIEGFYGSRQSLKQLASNLEWKEASIKVALCRARKVLGDCVEAKLQAEEDG
jgi:RNA polymerase sigma-70 factor (ECF subfamily)